MESPVCPKSQRPTVDIERAGTGMEATGLFAGVILVLEDSFAGPVEAVAILHVETFLLFFGEFDDFLGLLDVRLGLLEVS